MKTRAFTLIELLVVVLIIGILAAIALPQYEKSVAKSRAAQLQAIASSAASAIEDYYLATGTYPTKFEQLTLSYPLEPSTTTTCNISTSSNSAVVKGDGFEFILNTNSSFYFLTAQFTKGDYKCTGFSYSVYNKASLPVNQLLCLEDTRSEYRGSKNERGDFCEKVMGRTFYNNAYSYDYFD